MRTDEHHIEKHSYILALKDEFDIQVVFLGDSLTRRWEDNIELWERFFSEYQAANFGVGADCLENIKWRILNGQLDGINPKIIIVLTGTNNLDNDSEDTIATGIQNIVGIIQKKLPQTQIVLLGLFPRNQNETGIDYAQKIDRINSQLQAFYANSQVAFRDLGPVILSGHDTVRPAIMPDGLHLNYAGYEVIGPELKRIIDEFWS
jgi:lysophospholipase L1-like esterase